MALRTAIQFNLFVKIQMNNTKPAVATRTPPVGAPSPFGRTHKLAEPTPRNPCALGNRVQLTWIQPGSRAVDTAVDLNAIQLKRY